MSRSSSGCVGPIAVLALWAILAVSSANCAPGPAKALQVANTFGFTNPNVTDSHYFFVGWHSCSTSDGVAHDVKAKNSKEKDVDLVICCGSFWKGCTVRTP